MKKELSIALTLLAALTTSPAAVYSLGSVEDSGTSLGSLQSTTIQDGNPVGMWNTMDLSSANLGSSLSSITVTLDVTDGNNSGLYAYLSYNGSVITLLNRIGVSSTTPFGNTSSGLNNITLDSISSDVHLASGTPSGSYSADGRAISPFSSAANFDSADRVTLNGTFAGMNPNGTWTLFFADVVGGGGNATLNGWSLDITAVPEPVNVAMALFGTMLFGAGAVRKLARRRKTTLLEP